MKNVTRLVRVGIGTVGAALAVAACSSTSSAPSAPRPDARADIESLARDPGPITATVPATGLSEVKSWEVHLAMAGMTSAGMPLGMVVYGLEGASRTVEVAYILPMRWDQNTPVPEEGELVLGTVAESPQEVVNAMRADLETAFGSSPATTTQALDPAIHTRGVTLIDTGRCLIALSLTTLKCAVVNGAPPALACAGAGALGGALFGGATGALGGAVFAGRVCLGITTAACDYHSLEKGGCDPWKFNPIN
jgi:hypothetical protein